MRLVQHRHSIAFPSPEGAYASLTVYWRWAAISPAPVNGLPARDFPVFAGRPDSVVSTKPDPHADAVA